MAPTARQESVLPALLLISLPQNKGFKAIARPDTR